VQAGGPEASRLKLDAQTLIGRTIPNLFKGMLLQVAHHFVIHPLAAWHHCAIGPQDSHGPRIRTGRARFDIVCITRGSALRG
jgi:hypothetical protein